MSSSHRFEIDEETARAISQPFKTAKTETARVAAAWPILKASFHMDGVSFHSTMSVTNGGSARQICRGLGTKRVNSTDTVLLMDVSPADQASIAAKKISAADAPWVRIYSRHLMNIAILMMLPLILADTLDRSRTLFVDPDIWWHLANARILWTTHHIIWTDPYSFTVVGQRWINWEWLAEQPFWVSYKVFGLRGIYLVTWLLLGANILFVYLRGYWLCRRADAALWTAAIAFILMTVNSGPRTIEFAYLAMSAELAILEAADRGHKKLLWLLPPLFCLWINLHGMWFAGMVLLALYIGCGLFSINLGVFEQQALSRSDRNRLLAVLGASFVMLFINPYGWHLMWQPVDMILNQKVSVSTIAEWQPLNLATLEGKFVVIAIALMVIANCIRGRKWKIYEMTFVFLAWYAAISHVRFSYFAAVLTTPMLARDLARSFNMEEDTKTIPGANVAMAFGALCVILYMFPSEAALKKMVGMMFPMQTIAMVEPNWRTLDWDYVGGMMDFQGKPAFIDSRFDSFEHLGIMQDYRSIMATSNAFELMNKYRVDHALLKDDLPITYLLLHTPGWQVIAREKAWQGEYILFAKTPGATSVAATCATTPPSASH